MAVITVTAPPGKGKTLTLVRVAQDLFYKENNLIPLIHKPIKKDTILENIIYSNFPILVYKSKEKFQFRNSADEIVNAIPIKKILGRDKPYFCECSEDDIDKEGYGMFSNIIKFTDMRLIYEFKPNACFFIDEVSYTFDSMEYNEFPDCMAHFFAIHRHLGYNMIYTNSQSLSRIIKRILCVTEEFMNVISKVDFLFWSIMSFKLTYDIVSSKNDENNEKFDSDYVTKVFLKKRVYEGYNTKYLGEFNDNLPRYNKGCYNSLKMSKKDILAGFIISREEKEDLKRQLF